MARRGSEVRMLPSVGQSDLPVDDHEEPALTSGRVRKSPLHVLASVFEEIGLWTT